MSGYSFSRNWFDFSFNNADRVSPTHTAMYLWFVELNNRMGWVEKFASPASQTMSAIGLKSYNTYKKIFTDLAEFGFITVITESKNQYTACIIALSKFDKAKVLSLDHSIQNTEVKEPQLELLLHQNLTTHCIGTVQSTVQSNDSINKPKTKKPKTSFTVANLTVEQSAEIFNTVTKFFLDDYADIHKTKYLFTAKDGTKVKSIIKNIVKKMGERTVPKEMNVLNISDATNVFLKASYEVADNWLKSNYNLSNLDSKFNDIYILIKNRANGNPQQITKQQSTYESSKNFFGVV